MPIFEYCCPVCQTPHEAYRKVENRDYGPICCKTRARRILSIPTIKFGKGCTRESYAAARDRLDPKSHAQKAEWDRKCETGEITNEMIIHL